MYPASRQRPLRNMCDSAQRHLCTSIRGPSSGGASRMSGEGCCTCMGVQSQMLNLYYKSYSPGNCITTSGNNTAVMYDPYDKSCERGVPPGNMICGPRGPGGLRTLRLCAGTRFYLYLLKMCPHAQIRHICRAGEGGRRIGGSAAGMHWARKLYLTKKSQK